MKRNLRDLLLLILPVLGLLNSGCPGKSPAPTAPGPSGPPTFSYGVSFGASGGTTMNTPNGLAVSGGNLWVANEYIFGYIQEWTTAGSETFSSTTYNSTSYNFPRDAAAGPDGYIYIADGSHLVVELTSAGAYVTVFGTAELGTDDLDGVAVGSTRAYLLDDTVPQVVGYTIGGTGAAKTFTSPVSFGSTALGTIPKGIALDGAGNVYVADSANDRVVKFNSAGVTQAAVTLVSSGVPTGMAVDGAGYLYAADNHNHEVQMFDSSGAAVTQFGAADLSGAQGIALDSSGNLYVSDAANNRVVKFNKN